MTKVDYVNKGLYETVYEGSQRRRCVLEIKNDASPYRVYCVQCESMSVFKAESQNIVQISIPVVGHIEPPKDDLGFNGDIDFGKRLRCAMCGMFMSVYFKVIDDIIADVVDDRKVIEYDNGLGIVNFTNKSLMIPKIAEDANSIIAPVT